MFIANNKQSAQLQSESIVLGTTRKDKYDKAGKLEISLEHCSKKKNIVRPIYEFGIQGRSPKEA